MNNLALKLTEQMPKRIISYSPSIKNPFSDTLVKSGTPTPRTYSIDRMQEITDMQGRWLAHPETGKLERTSMLRIARQDSLGTNDVWQGHFGICVEGISSSNLLKTIGLGLCVAMTLHDPDAKVGLLAHLDAGKDAIDSMPDMLDIMRAAGATYHRLKARLIGGIIDEDFRYLAEPTIITAMDALEQYGIPLVELDILGNKTRKIIFDVESGEVFNLIDYVQEPIDPQKNLFDSMSSHSAKLLFNEDKNGFIPEWALSRFNISPQASSV